MSVLYATTEFEIRRQALSDAMRCDVNTENVSVGEWRERRETVDITLARADKILAWYLRDATKTETESAS